jgi:hypothetical protein
MPYAPGAVSAAYENGWNEARGACTLAIRAVLAATPPPTAPRDVDAAWNALRKRIDELQTYIPHEHALLGRAVIRSSVLAEIDSAFVALAARDTRTPGGEIDE